MQVDYDISFEARKRCGLRPFKELLRKALQTEFHRTLQTWDIEFWYEMDDTGTTHLHAADRFKEIK